MSVEKNSNNNDNNNEVSVEVIPTSDGEIFIILSVFYYHVKLMPNLKDNFVLFFHLWIIISQGEAYSFLI